MARLKQLAPRVRIPPSPKSNAWIASATEIASAAPHGPSTIAAIAIPTACPVVPPGSGRLNIMMTNEKAAKSEIKGTKRVASSARTRRSAIVQNGSAAA